MLILKSFLNLPIVFLISSLNLFFFSSPSKAEQIKLLVSENSEDFLLNVPPFETQVILTQHHHNFPENDDDPSDFGDPIDDQQIFWEIRFDQLEYQVNDAHNTFKWDLSSWRGGDYQKFVFKTEGDVSLNNGNGEAELQLLYSKQISPYWDFQTGFRYQQLYGERGNSRGFAVIGIQGLAPYFIEIDTALFISHEGDISARIKAEYELLLTQRLILQPKLEANLAIQEVENFGIGSGFNNLEVGLRLRYEVNRQFSPYLGISWEKLLGNTAKFAEEEGESSDNLKLVLGMRLMF